MIGLGEMGLPMGANLVARGFDVAGYDLRQEACQALAALGGKIARSAGDAVREQQAVVVMVRTPAQAEQVVLGEERAGTGAARHHIDRDEHGRSGVHAPSRGSGRE